MTVVDRAAAEIVRRCERGEISPAVALMELLIATEDADAVQALLRNLPTESPAAASLGELFAEQEEGCRRVAAMLRADVDVPPPSGASMEEGVAFCRNLFDWSVRQSEEASVALYSLGSARLLADATAEIATLLRGWGVLGRERVLLDFGCGTGRMVRALAADVARIDGLDVSSEMVVRARRRCGDLPNVTFWQSSGLDLAPIATRSCDLVLAVDSFPYVVQAGGQLPGRMFAEGARVLRAGGELIIFNYSYRQDLDRDRREIARLSTRHRFEVLENGTLPFRLWNATAHRLKAAG